METPYNINGNIAKAGTILLAHFNAKNDKATMDGKIFVPWCDYTKSVYHDYIPIGVVVMPYSHTTDKTVRVMSLKNMSLNNPSNGSAAQEGLVCDTSLIWGAEREINGLKPCTQLPTLEGNLIKPKDYAYFPSDYYGDKGKGNEFKYSVCMELMHKGISPYSSHYRKNLDALAVIDKETNSLLDYDGKGNTKKILMRQALQTITNRYCDGNFPSANLCSLYKTKGLGRGEWYLPSVGELTYLILRYGEINAALSRIERLNPNLCIRLWNKGDSSFALFGTWLWSSSQASHTYANYVDICSGEVFYNNKSYTNENNRVRAFASLKLV